jgi:hypothetical protein
MSAARTDARNPVARRRGGERLTFEHDGREERITGVLNAARPIPGVLG